MPRLFGRTKRRSQSSLAAANGPAILVASVGGDDDRVGLLREDRAIYEAFYANVTVLEAEALPQLFEFLAGKAFDVLHLIIDVDSDQTIGGMPVAGMFDHLIRVEPTLIVFAADKGQLLDDASDVTTIWTLDRKGDKFSSFFTRIFELVADGESFGVAWVTVAPQGGRLLDEGPDVVATLQFGQSGASPNLGI